MALNRKRKIIIGSAVAVLLGVIVVVSILASSKDVPEVTTIKIQPRPELRSTVTASGEVRPIRYIKLTSEVQGRIEEIYVNPGDQVTKGKPLVRLDPTQLQTSQEAQAATEQAAISDLQNARTQVVGAENAVSQAQQALTVAEASVAGARQQVVSAQTNVDRAQVDLNTAQRELKRSTELVEAGVASRSDYDAARDRYDQAQVALRTARANLDVQKVAVEEAVARANQQKVAVRDARISVQRAQQSVTSSESRATAEQARLRGQESQRSKATQYSPLNGVVADIPTRVGEFALANFSTTPLMTIADMSTINVEVNVDETEISKVEEGQPVRIKVDAFGDRELNGVVVQKNPLAVGKNDTTGGGLNNRVDVQEAKEFKVVIEMRDLSDDIRNGLRPGMSATATITTKVNRDVLAVPLQAIIEKSPTPAGSPGATPTSASAQPTPLPMDKPKDIKGVYILQGNKVKFVEVTTGITGESDIEITSGLQPGMEVVTGPSRVMKSLKDGTVIKRQERKPGAPVNANEGK